MTGTIVRERRGRFDMETQRRPCEGRGRDRRDARSCRSWRGKEFSPGASKMGRSTQSPLKTGYPPVICGSLPRGCERTCTGARADGGPRPGLPRSSQLSVAAERATQWSRDPGGAQVGCLGPCHSPSLRNAFPSLLQLQGPLIFLVLVPQEPSFPEPLLKNQ